MSPIIHHRRTVAANAVDRIRQRLSEINRSYREPNIKVSIGRFSKEKNDALMSQEDARAEILQEWLENREIEALEWVLREIFEAVP